MASGAPSTALAAAPPVVLAPVACPGGATGLGSFSQDDGTPGGCVPVGAADEKPSVVAMAEGAQGVWVATGAARPLISLVRQGAVVKDLRFSDGVTGFAGSVRWSLFCSA